MSGHSKWSTIKRKKGANDLKRGQLFTKVGKAISIAAREGGADPETNFSLRLSIDKAREINMPSDNIERAIKRGRGEIEGETLEKAVYGGYGPGGVAIVVDVLTDNKNRTVSELRKIFDEHGGNLSDASSVLWQFKEKGRVVVKCVKMEKTEKFGKKDKQIPVNQEEMMMKLMDIEGVEDIKEWKDSDKPEEKYVEVVTNHKGFAAVRGKIEDMKYVPLESELVKIPDNTIEISEKDSARLLELMNSIDDHDDVENIWVNTAI